MTREDIIQMAQKAGFVWLGEYHSNLEDFAKLVAQHEREACAKLLEEAAQAAKDADPHGFVWIAIKTSAEGIRARGDKHD
jgi:hypothetical protein